MTEHIKPFYEVKFAITVDSLTKIYPLYEKHVDRLKETLSWSRKKYHKDFFALDKVSFNIEKGDFLGIIGQNGSGKSTLLKVISRVLTPTSGNFSTKGRVISLLELGAGFNYELTGLENIRFYGTILGFNKKEIEARTDAIIAFADIGSFINQPLKTYSSGMKSRLAFAVASNVDPDILILDEVLAVGDLRFRQKCYRVMQEFVAANKTVLLVTHSMGAVTNFCNKTLWLNDGKVQEFGESKEVVRNYVAFMNHGLEIISFKGKNRKAGFSKEITQARANEKFDTSNIRWININKFDSLGEYGAIIEGIALYLKEKNQIPASLRGGEWLSLFTRIHAKKNITSLGLSVGVKNNLGKTIFVINNYIYNKKLKDLKKNDIAKVRTDFKFPSLRRGKYFLTITVLEGAYDDYLIHHMIHDAIIVEVINTDPKFNKGLIVIPDTDYDSMNL